MPVVKGFKNSSHFIWGIVGHFQACFKKGDATDVINKRKR